ncbi:MAG TPA: folylpolyglutamate synthase/dihydrofolate synthase family protein [Candidatus Baltobacteraceae bacterium]
MTYEGASAYLMGTIAETVSRHHPYRLDRMRRFLHELGDPQTRYPTIHVGGTSGKGSTSTMIAAALSASGKRTGLHTKPHLQSMTERMRIDGLPISTDAFGDLLQELMPAIERTASDFGRPSYFETLLALAFAFFAREEVDVAVIEVGLGGTLDGTNVIEPRVSVITNVGLDHTDVLGNTLVDIAADKAGIAKPGVPLVTATEDFAARSVIEGHCREVGAPFILVDERARVTGHEGERYGQSFTVEADARYELSLPILGRFQQRNAATAIVAMEQLGDDLRPSVESVERGLANLVIPGRMEFFPGHPGVIFDIAHNPDKARNLADALVETFGDRRFVFVIAVAEGKDAAGVLAPLLELNSSFICTSFETLGRTAVRPQRLANMAGARGATARTIMSPIEALAVARRSGDGSQVVVVTGSTFVVSVLRNWWLTHVVERAPR